MIGCDTIAAICSGVGGAVSIIRLSGPDSLSVLKAVWCGKQSPETVPRLLQLGVLSTDHSAGEPVLAVFMPNPNSYTGEDVVEIHCHGGMLNTKRVLSLVLDQEGVRQAEPGEFTLRAFMNGKMDLTQAEAVADMIQAHSEMARKTAEHQLSGTLRSAVTAHRAVLSELLAECESRLDFPEDIPECEDPEKLALTAEKSLAELVRIESTRREGIIFREGVKVAIAGHPNAGKSSLLNLLLGYARAIVSDIPGTTRDTVEESAHIRGIPVCLIDTAGIRETRDPIERLGVQRSESTLAQAEVIFWLLDPMDDLSSEVGALLCRLNDPVLKDRIIPVWNKCDLIAPETFLPYDAPHLSVLKETGLELLFDRFEEKVWSFPHTEAPDIAVNARQSERLRAAVEALNPVPGLLREGGVDCHTFELAALQLRDAVSALGEITGETADPDVLDHIFSHFCIGK